MLDLLLSFLPFFALVLTGWLAARSGLLPLEGLGTLNTFVLFFGLPAMLFRLAASGALTRGWVPGLLLAYGAAGGLIVLLMLTLTRRQGWAARDGGLLALATAFPNTGFLGLPLLTGLLGSQVAGPVAATLLVDVLLLSSVCLAWAHSQSSGDVSPAQVHREEWQAALTSLKGAARNPLLWSMAAGALIAASGWALPHPVDETLRLLSLSATPAALFTLGAMLVRAQRAPRPRVDRHRSIWLPALFKLGLHPALVWGAGQVLAYLGVVIPAVGLLTLILAAALPSASNVSMLAEREGADTALVARLILWSTAAALVTVTLWARLLGVQAAVIGH